MTTKLAPYSSNSEQTLVRAGQSGESQALNTLFHRHRNLLFHSALGITGNREDAEDALQDGLLCAFRSLKSFEGRSKFSSWLTRIVINAALMHRRRLLSRPQTVTLEPIGQDEVPTKERLVAKGLTPEQHCCQSEILKVAGTLVDALSPTLRTVFVLRVVLEFTSSEIAEMLDVPPNTVKARLWRARRQLARRVSRVLFLEMPPAQSDAVRYACIPAGCDWPGLLLGLRSADQS